jgi:hypothetical protein
LPGDGDGDVDAGHAGEHRGGQVRGELEQRGGACSPRMQTESAESFAETERAQRAAGLSAGKQPGRSASVAESSLGSPVGTFISGTSPSRPSPA